MGDLPIHRTTFSRPFTYTGIDFAGPFEIKSIIGRACRISKGYVCVFVCFCTKAIHLEPTTDLTTDAFLAAFTRFVSRRGCPLQAHSDNGKNFVGAARALSDDFLPAAKDHIIPKFVHQPLTWHFIPPGAPHMGGLWEAGVKSFKALFYKSTYIIKRNYITYLKELHKRNKWQSPKKNLEVNDLVVVKEDNLPINEWPLGRIQQTYPGAESSPSCRTPHF